MTRKEIIDFLKFERDTTIKLVNTCHSNQTNYFKQRIEAYNMAIKVLEQESCNDYISRQKMLDENIYEKLNQLLETCTDEESKEALKSAINGLKCIENELELVDDLVIKILNNKDETIAKIVFRTNGGFHYSISEKEMTGCFVHDIDSYNDNEVTYKINLDTEIYEENMDTIIEADKVKSE